MTGQQAHSTHLSTAWASRPGQGSRWEYTVICECGWDSDGWESRTAAVNAGLAHCQDAAA